MIESCCTCGFRGRGSLVQDSDNDVAFVPADDVVFAQEEQDMGDPWQSCSSPSADLQDSPTSTTNIATPLACEQPARA